MQNFQECWGLGVISKCSSFVRLTVTTKIGARYSYNSIWQIAK